MYQVQINKNVLRNHFQYDAWKYLLGAVLTIFFWSMVTTIAAPRTPDELKVDIYMVGNFMFDEAAQAVADTILADFPELKEINFFNIMLGRDPHTEHAGQQKLMVMLASQTGDIYIFDKERFEIYARQGAFHPLNDYIDDFRHLFTEAELEEFTFTVDDANGEPMLYGLPMDSITIMDETGLIASEAAIGVMSYSKNQERALEVLQWLFQNGRDTGDGSISSNFWDSRDTLK